MRRVNRKHPIMHAVGSSGPTTANPADSRNGTVADWQERKQCSSAVGTVRTGRSCSTATAVRTASCLRNQLTHSSTGQPTRSKIGPTATFLRSSKDPSPEQVSCVPSRSFFIRHCSDLQRSGSPAAIRCSVRIGVIGAPEQPQDCPCGRSAGDRDQAI